MAEIDIRPLDSVQAAVTHFDTRSVQNRFSPDRNEEEIVIISKDLATCKLQLEVKENQHKQATLKIEALQKAMQEFSDKYDRDTLDAHIRIAQLEAENITVMSRQSETAGECKALRDELAVVKGELEAARASVAYVLGEVEMMEMRAIVERESTKDALTRILQLNETVLSSAVAAIRAEEERSVFYQEATLEFFNSDKNLEVIRRQMETMESMETELLAKTVEIEYLRSELKQVQELYMTPQKVSCFKNPQEASDATVITAGCDNLDDHQVQVCETSAENDQEAEAEFTIQHTPDEFFVPETFRNDCQVVPSDNTKMEIKMSENVAEDKGEEVMVQITIVLEGNSDAEEARCLVAKISGEDHVIQPDGKNVEAVNKQEPEADGIVPNSTACEVNLLQDQVEPKADASFVLESSRDDFQSVHSDDKDISIAVPEIVAGSQEPRAEGNSDTRVVATEIVSKDEDEFYTKEIDPEAEQGTKLQDGYVLVAKSGDAEVVVKDKQLDAARMEISDLRFSLEEAVRRAELAEEAKAALERELREEIRRKHTPLRRRATSDSEDARRPPAREGGPPPPPSRPRPTPSQTPGTTPSRAPRSARLGGEDMPTPRCVTLGKVLNMKYK